MKLTLKEFEKYLDALESVQNEYAKDVYLTVATGCVPAGYEGDDLMLEIIYKFKFPLWFVIKAIASEKLLKQGQHLYAMVEPSYEDSTHSIVYLHDISPPCMKIVYDDWTKPWNYWFANKAEFEKHLKAIHDTILRNIKG